jgi:hypothetical protein
VIDEAKDLDLRVLDGIDLKGDVNTSDDVLVEQIGHSIRLGHQQVRGHALQAERVCLVGGGPSLNDTFDELRELYFAGAKVVTVNGSYQWCLERNIRPSAQIVLDARATNARFVDPDIPQCRYLLASQCHRDTWAAVEGRPDVWIWHAVAGEGPQKDLLDAYYLGQWQPVSGGTTVVMRALLLLRTLGFVRFDLFGVDSCWMGEQHHAYDQPENASDKRVKVTVSPSARTELARDFWCAPWHMQQLADFLQTIRVNGEQFVLNVHGDGLLAFVLRAGAEVVIREQAAQAVRQG